MSCTCNNGQAANNVGGLFFENADVLAPLFVRYGGADMKVTPENAVKLARQNGAPFLADLKAAFDSKQPVAAVTGLGGADIGTFVTGLVGQAAGIAGTVTNYVAQAKATKANTGSTAAGQPQVVYVPQPTAAAPVVTEPKKYFGFTAMQLGLIGAIAVGVGLIVWFNRK